MAKPAYQRIKEAILDNIHQGIWQVGDAIDTELALSLRFGVSRMTVNRALKELTEERVLERRQGSGTFVAQTKFSQTFVVVQNISTQITKMGKSYHACAIWQGLVDRPNTSEPIFVDSQQIYQVDIVHFGDNEPLQFERRFVDLNLVPEFSHQDFNVVNTTDFLLSAVPLVRGKYYIQAIACPKDIAKHLKISTSSPALRLSRYTYSGDKVVTYVQMWHDGQNFSFSGMLGS